MGDLRNLLERGCELTVSRQCELLELSRFTYYYEACVASKRDLMLMNSIDPKKSSKIVRHKKF